jgi:hypothetical protein
MINAVMVHIDEMSFLSPSHMGTMSSQAAAALPARAVAAHWPLERKESSFAGMHVILSGDVFQHRPVGAVSLWEEGKPGDGWSVAATLGREVYLQFQTVVVYDTVHRQSDTRDGQLLKEYSSRFCHWRSRIDRQLVDQFCDALQSRVITKQQLLEMIPKRPRVLVLRNAVRHSIAYRLSVLHANHLGKRITMWRSVDTLGGKQQRPVPEQLAADALLLPANKTAQLNGIAWFYQGCPCTFLDNKQRSLGRTRNAFGYMESLVLDPREPACSNPEEPCRWLQYVPLGVIVSIPQKSGGAELVAVAATKESFVLHAPQPTNTNTDDQHVPKRKGKAAQLLAATDGVQQPPRKRAKVTQKLTITRQQVPLGDGFAVTDYFSQVRSKLCCVAGCI